MYTKRCFILLMSTFMLLSGLFAAESWQTDAERADRYYFSGDPNAAWLFYERAMARGLDDGRALFHAAESFRQQEIINNENFGSDLYAVAFHYLEMQYPNDPSLEKAAAYMTPHVEVNRRFLRQTYAVVGGRVPATSNPIVDRLDIVSSFFVERVGEVGEFYQVLRLEGPRAGLSWARERIVSLLLSLLVTSALTGIILPLVMALTVSRESRKSYVSAYALLLHWGFLGLHRFYLGRNKSGIVWLLTGGLLGLGLFFDIFLTAAYTRFWNEDHRSERPRSGRLGTKTTRKARTMTHPPGSKRSPRPPRPSKSPKPQNPRSSPRPKPMKQRSAESIAASGSPPGAAFDDISDMAFEPPKEFSEEFKEESIEPISPG